jgi:hypothetical protein
MYAGWRLTANCQAASKTAIKITGRNRTSKFKQFYLSLSYKSLPRRGNGKPLENDCVVVVKGKTAFEQAQIDCKWLAAGYNKPDGQTHQRPR